MQQARILGSERMLLLSCFSRAICSEQLSRKAYKRIQADPIVKSVQQVRERLFL